MRDIFSFLLLFYLLFPPKCIENTFKAVQSTLDLKKCILGGANT